MPYSRKTYIYSVAAITYEYHEFRFNRLPLAPVSEAEYSVLRTKHDDFIDAHLDAAKAEFSKLKNPHRFKRRNTLIMLGIAVLFIVADQGLKALGYYDAGEWFAILTFVVLLAFVVQAVQWFRSLMSSTPFSFYQKHARAYFLFHHHLIEKTKSYTEYLTDLSKADQDAYEDFLWRKRLTI